MLGTWIDYDGGTVSGAAMAAAGVTGAIRYVGIGGEGKRLTRTEYVDHRAHGRVTLAVVELGTRSADGGYSAGVANAAAAARDLAELTAGLPPIQFVFAANDKPEFDEADVQYVRGLRDRLGSTAVVGPYGFGAYLAACHAAGLAPIAWQAGPAPSRTDTESIATFWQRNGGPCASSDGPAHPPTLTIDGIPCDLSNQLKGLPVTNPLTPDNLDLRSLEAKVNAIYDNDTDLSGWGNTPPVETHAPNQLKVALNGLAADIANLDAHTSKQCTALAEQIAALAARLSAVQRTVDGMQPPTG